MTTHQQKKLDDESLIAFRDRFALPLSDAETLSLDFYKPAEDSVEMKYLRARRAALGGALPARRTVAPALPVPAASAFARFAFEPSGKGGDSSSTMAFVRMLTNLTRDRGLGRHVVPIVADEARTFGMQAMFRGIGIYSPHGQAYEPEDADELLYYKEARDGQILEEGITEAGALSSWIAAATSHANHGVAMLPFYIYYSIFGFQRVADLIWAAADQRARGFLIGATAGRTTLSGEGLQHQDGSSHLVASTVPNCRAYDPCYGYEVATIIEEGMQAMLARGEDVFYYMTVMNENTLQAPADPLVREGIVRGMYRLRKAEGDVQVRLLGSGAILPEVLAAAELLKADCAIEAEVYSVTSYTELQRDGVETARATLSALLESDTAPGKSWVARCLGESRAPVIAASDYVRALPELIRAQIDARYVTLGTDGFGRSDTRAALRDFFEVDRRHIAVNALAALAQERMVPAARVAALAKRLGVRLAPTPPWRR